MKVLIVEDESAAADNLQEMLHEIDPTIEVLGNTESVQQTMRWLQQNVMPDLIFMEKSLIRYVKEEFQNIEDLTLMDSLALLQYLQF